jgi:hypothetical protein
MTPDEQFDEMDDDLDDLPPQIRWHRRRPTPPPRWLRVLRRLPGEEDV